MSGMDFQGRWITERDYQAAVKLCEDLSAQVRRLKRERSRLRMWLRWAIGRCETGGVFVGLEAKTLAMRGRPCRDLKPDNVDMGELGVGCPTCAAKPGERCASLINAANYREPHAGRRARALAQENR